MELKKLISMHYPVLKWVTWLLLRGLKILPLGGSAWDAVNQDEDFSEIYKSLEELGFNWVSHITARQLM